MIGSQIDFGLKPSHSELDITNAKAVFDYFKAKNPEIVIHLAALDMVKSEQNPALARLVNVGGSVNIAKACLSFGAKIVYVSTCAVFDGGKDRPYLESDKPNPVNIYGQTKLEAENIIKEIVPSAVIARLGWAFGGSQDKKFVRLAFDKLIREEKLSADNWQVGSLSYLPDIISAIKKIISDFPEKSGLLHIANRGFSTRYEIALKIAEHLGKISLVEGKKYVQPVPRGRMEAIQSSKIKIRPWQEALEEYISELQS